MLFAVKGIDYLFLLRVFSPDLNGAFDNIDVFEDLQSKVIIEIRIVGEKLVDDRERLFGLLPADERREPAVDEENLSITFVVG